LNLHSLSLDDALGLGFRVIGAGVIESNECSAQGLLMPHHCMGRISDSMPHLWGAVFPESQASEEEGGAVVEFRRTYDELLMAGDAFQVVSCIVEVGARVQSFAHLMFNLRTGHCCVNAQAVALRMDLRARKAITMSEAALALLDAQRIQLPNL
jgi:acyl-CoA thioester hydrolase